MIENLLEQVEEKNSVAVLFQAVMGQVNHDNRNNILYR